MNSRKRGKKQIFKNMDKEVFDWSGSVHKKDGKQKQLRYTNEALWNVEHSFNQFMRSFVEKLILRVKNGGDQFIDGSFEVTKEMVDHVKDSFPKHWFNHDTDLLDGCSQPGEMIDRLSQSYVAQLSSSEESEDEEPVAKKTLDLSISKRGEVPRDSLLATSESEDEEPVVKKKLNLSISKRGVTPKDFEQEGDFTDSFVMGFSQSLFDAPLPSLSTLFTPPQVNPDDLIEGMSKVDESIPEQDEAPERSVEELPKEPEKPRLLSFDPFSDEPVGAEKDRQIKVMIDRRKKEYERKMKEYRQECTAKKSKAKNLVKRRKKNDMPSF